MYRTVEKYNLLSVIAKGAFSTVYKASCQDDERDYAIKVLKMSVLKNSPLLYRFTMNEMNALLKIAHPNIIKFIKMMKTSNNLYLVYEYCNEGTLHQLIKNRKCLPEKEALAIFYQILEGYNVLQARGIIHRDLKPQNILLHNSVVKIADFGFCRVIGPSELAKTFVGSPIYMAPEVLKKLPYDIKADIWSLGVILYEMLLGFCPFDALSIPQLVQQTETKMVKIPKFAEISTQTRVLIISMLIVNPKKRIAWQSLVNQTIQRPSDLPLEIYSTFRQNDSYWGTRTMTDSETNPLIDQKYSLNYINDIKAFRANVSLEFPSENTLRQDLLNLDNTRNNVGRLDTSFKQPNDYNTMRNSMEYEILPNANNLQNTNLISNFRQQNAIDHHSNFTKADRPLHMTVGDEYLHRNTVDSFQIKLNGNDNQAQSNRYGNDARNTILSRSPLHSDSGHYGDHFNTNAEVLSHVSKYKAIYRAQALNCELQTEPQDDNIVIPISKATSRTNGYRIPWSNFGNKHIYRNSSLENGLAAQPWKNGYPSQMNIISQKGIANGYKIANYDLSSLPSQTVRDEFLLTAKPKIEVSSQNELRTTRVTQENFFADDSLWRAKTIVEVNKLTAEHKPLYSQNMEIRSFENVEKTSYSAVREIQRPSTLQDLPEVYDSSLEDRKNAESNGMENHKSYNGEQKNWKDQSKATTDLDSKLISKVNINDSQNYLSFGQPLSYDSINGPSSSKSPREKPVSSVNLQNRLSSISTKSDLSSSPSYSEEAGSPQDQGQAVSEERRPYEGPMGQKNNTRNILSSINQPENLQNLEERNQQEYNDSLRKVNFEGLMMLFETESKKMQNLVSNYSELLMLAATQYYPFLSYVLLQRTNEHGQKLQQSILAFREQDLTLSESERTMLAAKERKLQQMNSKIQWMLLESLRELTPHLQRFDTRNFMILRRLLSVNKADVQQLEEILNLYLSDLGQSHIAEENYQAHQERIRRCVLEIEN